MKQHDYQDLIRIFNDLFAERENTILIGGYEEPLYLPADNENSACRVIFTRDYFASALHEIAHWCMAGDERRKLVDYGYWYYPEGRTSEQQSLFEQAEIKPQALECIFANAAGSRFLPSRDDFSVDNHNRAEIFAANIAAQVQVYLKDGMPKRAELFTQKLKEFYGNCHNEDGWQRIVA